MTVRGQTPKGNRKIDFKDMEQANKAAKTIEDLEILLHKRTEEYEQAMNDLSIFETSVVQLSELKVQMEEDIREAEEMLANQSQ